MTGAVRRFARRTGAQHRTDRVKVNGSLANGGTIGFTAASKDEVDAFHASGLASGGKTCEDPPGIREGGGVQLYIAYLRDLDGNKICAVHRMG
jgi:predicted lactoylglutathione lyase